MDFLSRKCTICGTQFPLTYIQPCEVDFAISWSFWCEKHSQSATEKGCEKCAYQFANILFFDPKLLAAKLCEQWALGTKVTEKSRVSDWLLESGRSKILAGKVRELERRKSLTADDRFALIVMTLSGDGIVRWRGLTVSMGWLRNEETLGLELLRGQMSDCMVEFELGTWLYEIKEHWKSILKEIPESADAEKIAYTMLFRATKVGSLSGALTAATFAPRFYLPTILRSSSHLAKLGDQMTDGTSASAPEVNRLKELFLAICGRLRDGKLPNLSSRAFYEATFLLGWRYRGSTLLEHSDFKPFFVERLKTSIESRILKSLVFGYLRDFDARKPDYVNALGSLIKTYIENGTTAEFHRWRELDHTFGLFSGLAAPEMAIRRFVGEDGLEIALRQYGLVGTNLWAGFSAELLLCWVTSLGGYEVNRWDLIRHWFEKCSAALAQREHEWVEAVVSVWRGTSAPGQIRRRVSRYLTDRFGEPDRNEKMWKQCSQEVCEIVNQWLVFENLERFFDLIADYAEESGGEMRTQWDYRKAFWLAVYKTGVVSDIRILASRGFINSLGKENLLGYFGSKLWNLKGSDEKRCAMVMKLDDLILVDFTHNAKCRVWKASESHSDWFGSHFTLKGGDLIIHPQYSEPGLAHFSSETYGWQRVMSEFLQPHLPVRLEQADFEYRQQNRGSC